MTVGEIGSSQKDRQLFKVMKSPLCENEGLLSSIRICREGNNTSKERLESLGFYEE